MPCIDVEQEFDLTEFFCEGLQLKNRDPKTLGLKNLKLGKLHGAQPYWRRARLSPHSNGIRLGAKVFKTCWLNRAQLPTTLRHHQQLYFDGDVLINEFGQELVFYLRWTKQDWNKDNTPMDWRWGICATTYLWSDDYMSLVY